MEHVHGRGKVARRGVKDPEKKQIGASRVILSTDVFSANSRATRCTLGDMIYKKQAEK